MTGASDQLFLGVDGGGTGCRARLQDSDGRLLGEGKAGPANARLGEPAIAEIMGACRQSMLAAGLGEKEYARVHAGFGLAGVAQPKDRAFVLDRSYPFASLTLDTDAYAAWLGAFGGDDGAILIVGTGSCGLAVIGGRRFNVGGWGPDISDDGSGAAIGRAAIRRSLWAHEGMGPLTPFAETVLDRFQREPERIVGWTSTAISADYARLAPLAFEAAEKGDALAREIIAEAARDIARMIGRLLELGAPSVAMVGGLADPMVGYLSEEARRSVVGPAADAVDGAILMARRASVDVATMEPVR